MFRLMKLAGLFHPDPRLQLLLLTVLFFFGKKTTRQSLQTSAREWILST
jgi:hypothetical protein